MKGLWISIGIVVLALGLVLVAGTVLAQTEVTVNLEEQNDSGESGTAVLTDMGNNQVQVVVTIENAPAGVSQPMHIHEGTCDNLNAAPKYPLTNLVDGKSTTVVSTTLASLLASPHAINGHKSAEEASVYVFCGNIAEAGMQGTTTPEATTAMTATVTTEATAAATTEATPPATLPATGGTPTDMLIPIFILGLIVLALGLTLRRAMR